MTTDLFMSFDRQLLSLLESWCV